jgi:hypothetical protein
MGLSNRRSLGFSNRASVVDPLRFSTVSCVGFSTALLRLGHLLIGPKTDGHHPDGEIDVRLSPAVGHIVSQVSHERPAGPDFSREGRAVPPAPA